MGRKEEQIKSNELLREECKMLKSNLTKAQEIISRLEYLEDFKGSASDIAHEINNSINFVMTSISVIDRSVNDFAKIILMYKHLEGVEELPGYDKLTRFEDQIDVKLTQEELENALKAMRNGFERIQEISYNLGMLGKGQEGENLKIDINESVETTLFIVERKILGQIDIVKDLGQLPLIDSKKGKFNQVFTNLFKNAIEAIQEKDKLHKEEIFIQTRVENNNIVIRVRDTGIGMTEETQKKLFDRFYTTKPEGKGTGLGMGVIKEIIEAHNGTITFSSQRGKGTEFTIVLPQQA